MIDQQTNNKYCRNLIHPKIPSGKSFLVWLTHDVDRVYKSRFHSLYYFIQQRRFYHAKTLFFGGAASYWNFDRIMHLEEKYGARSTFFFLNEHLKIKLMNPKSFILAKGRYNINSPRLVEAIKEINSGGWDVGLHGSYNSFKNKDLLLKEKEQLEDILGHAVISSRQHYWNNMIPETWRIQNSIGIKFDTTFIKKYDVGFYENVYYPFRPFLDDFIVFPTAIMEKYLLEKALNNVEHAKKLIDSLITTCKEKRTILVVLWHQMLLNPKEFPEFYLLYKYLLMKVKEADGEFVLPSTIAFE